MTASPPRARALLAWLVVGPMSLVGGIALGHWLSARGVLGWTSAAPPWTDAPALRREVAIPSFAPIVRQVRAGVVGVRTLLREDALVRPPDDLSEAGAGSEGVVSGSGFVLNANGLVVTNYHLVADAMEILVELPGFRPRAAALVGVDPLTDIAVLRLDDPPAGLTALPLGDSTTVEQGDWVVVVGNPFQYRHSVTVGVVSYVGRHVPEEGLLVSNELLQFSAPVNPGSSGGPVVDAQGHVVGVTTAALGYGTGIAFAVPTKVLRWVLQRMEQHGVVHRGYLGVRLEPLDANASRGLGLGGGGALISRVQAGSPAARAGLADGDVVVAFNDRRVPDAYALFDWITYAHPGEQVVLEVVRQAKRIAPVAVQLGRVEPESAGLLARGAHAGDPQPVR